MKNENQNIDRLFREQLGNYSETPPPAVWESLEKRLSGGQKPRFTGWPWITGILVLLSIGGILVGKSLMQPPATASLIHESARQTSPGNSTSAPPATSSHANPSNNQLSNPQSATSANPNTHIPAQPPSGTNHSIASSGSDNGSSGNNRSIAPSGSKNTGLHSGDPGAGRDRQPRRDPNSQHRNSTGNSDNVTSLNSPNSTLAKRHSARPVPSDNGRQTTSSAGRNSTAGNTPGQIAANNNKGRHAGQRNPPATNHTNPVAALIPPQKPNNTAAASPGKQVSPPLQTPVNNPPVTNSQPGNPAPPVAAAPPASPGLMMLIPVAMEVSL